MARIYSFYNNKGGVGKTTLCANASSLYAETHPKTPVLVIDMCPQANISQFLLGGGHNGYEANQKLQSLATRKNVVGFIDWLLQGNSRFTTPQTSYRVNVSQYNPNIPQNVTLIAGDNFLESLSLALNYAVINPANTLAWSEYMTAIRRLCDAEFADTRDEAVVFIDCNPSFSIYTQMALLSSDYLIIPMMADFSSIEGIKGIFSMLYGKYSSPAMQKYAQNIVTFSSQVAQFKLDLPSIFELAFNNFTVNLGVATAYGSIRNELTEFCYAQYIAFPELFASTDPPPQDMSQWEKLYISDVKDFHTAGKVSATLGIPLTKLPERNSYTMPDGTRVEVPAANYENAIKHVRAFVSKLS